MQTSCCGWHWATVCQGQESTEDGVSAVLRVVSSLCCATASAGLASPAVLVAALPCQEMATGATLLSTHKVWRVNSKRGKAVIFLQLFLEIFLEELSSLLPVRFHQVMCRMLPCPPRMERKRSDFLHSYWVLFKWYSLLKNHGKIQAASLKEKYPWISLHKPSHRVPDN